MSLTFLICLIDSELPKSLSFLNITNNPCCCNQDELFQKLKSFLPNLKDFDWEEENQTEEIKTSNNDDNIDNDKDNENDEVKDEAYPLNDPKFTSIKEKKLPIKSDCIELENSLRWDIFIFNYLKLIKIFIIFITKT